MPFASAEIKLQCHLKVLPSLSGTGTCQGQAPCATATLVALLRVEVPGAPVQGAAGQSLSTAGRCVGAEGEVEDAEEERLPRNVSGLAGGMPWGKAEKQP